MAEETGTKSTLVEYKVNDAASVPYTSFNVENGKTTVKSGKTDDGKGSGGDAAGKANDQEGQLKSVASKGALKQEFQVKAQVNPNKEVLSTLAPNLAQNDEKNITFKPESERDKPSANDGMKNAGVAGVVANPFHDNKIDPLHHGEMDDPAAENYYTNTGSTKIDNTGKYRNAYNRARDPEEQKDSFGQTASQRASASSTASMLNRIQTMSYAEWNNLSTGQRQDMIDTAAQKLEQANQAVAKDLIKYDAVTKEFLQTKYGQAEGAALESDAIKISKETQDKALKEKGYTQADVDAGRISKAEANQIFANADKYAKEAIQAKYGNDPEKAKDVTDVANGRHGFGIRLAHDASVATGVDPATQENQTNTGDKGLGETQAMKAQADTTTKDSNYSINDFQQRTAELKNGNTLSATASISTPSDTSYTATQTNQTASITPTYNTASEATYQQAAPAMVAAAPQGASYTGEFNKVANYGAILPAQQNLTVAQQQQTNAQAAYMQDPQLEALAIQFREMMAMLQGTDPNKVQIIASNTPANTTPPPTQVAAANTSNNQLNMG